MNDLAIAEAKSKSKSVWETLSPTIPALATGLIAALSGYILASKAATDTRSKTFLDQRVLHSESAVVAIAAYTNVWQRLREECAELKRLTPIQNQTQSASLSASSAQITESQRSKKIISDLADDRPVKREALEKSLFRLRIYFSKSVSSEIEKISQWERALPPPSCQDQPDKRGLERQFDRLIGLISDELRQ